jgi:PAS domain S-box-containing protein
MYNKEQKTILLVDDDAISGLNLSSHLAEYGYNVVQVLTGQKAIDAINNKVNKIDLVLMDINLGEKLDGTDIARKILKTHDIPLLFHSSYIERDVVNRTENITSYGYVVKNGITVLDASIKMAFRLFEANQLLKNQRKEIETKNQNLEMLEKRYHRLFESARDGILILDADDGMIVDVNQYLIEMLGYSKEQFLNKNIWDISAYKNIDYSKHLFKELQYKNYVRYEDLPLETSDGKSLSVEFVSNVYTVDNKRVIQCNIRDITDRKKYEQLLIDASVKKESLIRELQHRTKNSFNLITNLIHLRSEENISNESHNLLEELTLRVRSVSDLYSLLYETDSFNKIQLDIYLKKVIYSMSHLSDSISISSNLDSVIVSSENAGFIGIILIELLTNSIKYAFPLSRGMINIELKTVNGKILLLVEDNGIGLKSDFDIATVTSLGLHLTYLMVGQLKGSAKFTTDNGTKILIEFPPAIQLN